ncbi:MAG: ABC transporter substrate-binding protein [Syntrophomonadaceae bacterium]|nr:ABC transporter substrate-binding protein [Syntrophomonadaceae bacterium]
MKSKLWAMVLLLMLGGLTGCGGNGGQNGHLQQVTFLLDWFPNVNHTGVYVAQEMGYYAEEGLSVSIMQAGDGSTAQLLAAGQGDFGISYQEDLSYARSQDVPAVAIAAVIQHNTSGFAAPPDRNIKSPADYAGKVYGGWGSPAESAILQNLMEAHGADFSKLTIVNIGSADFFSAIESGAIDFSWIFEGVTGVEARLRGMELDYTPLREENPAFDYYTPIIICSESMLNEQPERVRAFLKATARGYAYCIAAPEAAADILLQAAPELDAALVKEGQAYMAGQYQADAEAWGIMQQSTWQAYADFMLENGLLQAPIDVTQAFTNDYLP